MHFVIGVGNENKGTFECEWQPFPLETLVGTRRDISDSDKKNLKKGTVYVFSLSINFTEKLLIVGQINFKAAH